MGRLQTALLCFAGSLNLLVAQDPKPAAPKLPPAMEHALTRIAKGEPPPLEFRGRPPALANRVCSVPLLEVQVDHPQWFTVRRVAPPPSHDVMPNAVLPAPPCEKE
jgi:hypothetical protein